ncbi:MAG: Rieske 2Fe-2S domain-containing protein, partial [Nocardia sp.]|nr:Rieske 2Fe-2S domain-containing protein [Nocardia sp.]
LAPSTFVDSADDLAPGTGAVMRRSGKRCAVYRDTAGRLHTVSAVCTHLGCLVAFNDAETSWDCPCHGSRFDIDGAVLEGPATTPLRPLGTDDV